MVPASGGRWKEEEDGASSGEEGFFDMCGLGTADLADAAADSDGEQEQHAQQRQQEMDAELRRRQIQGQATEERKIQRRALRAQDSVGTAAVLARATAGLATANRAGAPPPVPAPSPHDPRRGGAGCTMELNPFLLYPCLDNGGWYSYENGRARPVCTGLESLGLWFGLGEDRVGRTGRAEEAPGAAAAREGGGREEHEARHEAVYHDDLRVEVEAAAFACGGCGRGACKLCGGAMARTSVDVLVDDSSPEGARVVVCGAEQLEVVMGCCYTPRMVFKHVKHLLSYGTYGFGATVTARADIVESSGGGGGDRRGDEGSATDEAAGAAERRRGFRNDSFEDGAPLVGIELASGMPAGWGGATVGDMLSRGALCPHLRIARVSAAPAAQEGGLAAMATSEAAEEPSFGLGLFATAALPAATFVGEYAGVLRNDEDMQRNDATDLSFSCFYASCFEPGMRLDALTYGNVVRCINHGSGAARNVEFRQVVQHGMVRVAALTTRPVARGEQLLVDYGTRYWTRSGYEPCGLVATAKDSVASSSAVMADGSAASPNHNHNHS